VKRIVGHVDVDAGIIHVGDPCYTMAQTGVRDEPGVSYGEMINRLVDHDDVVTKISHEQIQAIHDSLDENPYHPSDERWVKPVVTSLAPEPEDRDGVVHKWQAAYNPYGHEPPMTVRNPHKYAGIVVGSGYGDGGYPVEVEWEDEPEYSPGIPPTTFEFNGKTHVSDPGRRPSAFYRIKSVKVIFIGDGDDDEEV
jgi:hypothetical protein